MKKGIHPKYHNEALITCACGSELVTGSTKEKLHVEICSQCHPFYTGEKNVVDTTGRVDRFKKLTERAAVKKPAHRSKTEKKASRAKKRKDK